VKQNPSAIRNNLRARGLIACRVFRPWLKRTHPAHRALLLVLALRDFRKRGCSKGRKTNRYATGVCLLRDSS